MGGMKMPSIINETRLDDGDLREFVESALKEFEETTEEQKKKYGPPRQVREVEFTYGSELYVRGLAYCHLDKIKILIPRNFPGYYAAATQEVAAVMEHELLHICYELDHHEMPNQGAHWCSDSVHWWCRPIRHYAPLKGPGSKNINYHVFDKREENVKMSRKKGK